MTTTAIRKKVHQYIDEADTSVLEIVWKMLEEFRKTSTSSLTPEQQSKVMEASELYKAGKMKGYTINEVRKKIKLKLENI